jgi:hypothetical protein
MIDIGKKTLPIFVSSRSRDQVDQSDLVEMEVVFV